MDNQTDAADQQPPPPPPPPAPETVEMKARPARPRGPGVWKAPAVLAIALACVLGSVAGGAALATSEPAPTDAALVAAPAVGSCRVYDDKAAYASSNDSPTVSCSSPHTSETFAVAQTLPDSGTSGGWSPAQMKQAADIPCSEAAAAAFLGMTRGTFGTKRLVVLFFVPNPTQAKAGARWVRCDLALTDKAQLASVDGDFRTIVQVPGGFTRCIAGTTLVASLSAKCKKRAGQYAAIGWAHVPTYDGVSRIDISVVNRICRAQAVQNTRMANPTWAATLPPDEEWQLGRDYALCWVSVDQWKVDPTLWPDEQQVGGPTSKV